MRSATYTGQLPIQNLQVNARFVTAPDRGDNPAKDWSKAFFGLWGRAPKPDHKELVIIRQASHWQKITKTARRIFEAEKELLSHCLALLVLVALVGSAAYLDTRIQPKEARASLTQIAERTGPQQTGPATSGDGQAAPAPQPSGPGLPPPLTQNASNLNPELLRRFDAFRTFIFQTYGVVLEIRSGYRSTEEQAQLFRTLPPGRANPPGRSNHEKGEAIDYTNYSPQYNQHLAQFGLHLPFAGKENWHLERVEVNPYN